MKVSLDGNCAVLSLLITHHSPLSSHLSTVISNCHMGNQIVCIGAVRDVCVWCYRYLFLLFDPDSTLDTLTRGHPVVFTTEAHILPLTPALTQPFRIRGSELIGACPRLNYLQRLLGPNFVPEPARPHLQLVRCQPPGHSKWGSLTCVSRCKCCGWWCSCCCLCQCGIT